jgi:hypothetical protein
MAVIERENPLGYVDKRRVKGDLGNANGNPVAAGSGDASNYASVAGLRARLTAIDSTYYSSARLDKLTKNDMVYAVRQNDDAAGIK